jgi:hypothetical protein
MRNLLLTTVASVLLLAAAVQLQATRERAYPASEAADDAVYVASGSTLRHLTGAYNALAADAYWVRTIQYFGSTRRRLARRRPAPPPAAGAAAAPADYAVLYPLLDLTTSLDPQFSIAYRFGAVFLAEPYPGGPGRPDLAVALLDKGLRARPDKWEYMEDIGFVHYWYRHDYSAAAAWFQKAAEAPHAPWWLRSLAATTLAQGGDRASSRLMWLAIAQSAESAWLRSDAERRLRQLRALDDIDALQGRVDGFARSGGAVDDWMSLARARVLRGIPVDPAGTPYELSKGRVRLAQSSPLWPLPDEPMVIPTHPPS